uniref:CxC2-like cysteine cluster KDZ transposase-associated domain-containing protein n=1 Tax=Schizophyllum commune (strain H4-8 / FGSC 9210) TaxID=578458 RepID=D8PLA4_SCHCM
MLSPFEFYSQDTQDDPVGSFKPLAQEYLDEVSRWNSRGHRSYIEKCRECDDPTPRFRCRDECMGHWLFCQPCILRRHAYTPLHWIEEWLPSQQFFARTTLKDLGLRVMLNHPPGEHCLLKAAADKDFVVIHLNGIHNVAVDFCHCPQGRHVEHRQQLMRNGWWPATTTSPQTCATVACLRNFGKINALSKVAVSEYFKAMQHLSGNGDSKIPDKRRQFMNIVRQQRHVDLLQRGGRAHAEDGVASTQQGQLALGCPACPQPGRNLPSDWETAQGDKRYYMFQLFIAQDANFRLQNTTASSLLRDPPLGDGWAYFVGRQPYMDYIKQNVDEADISTCSGFAALFLANLKRVQGLRATGVAAVTCSRHNVFRPNAFADLQKGERFANMTYVLASALRASGVREVLHTYDVSCIFKVNLWRRNAMLPPDLRITIDPHHYTSRVPKFHLPAHKIGCHAKEALNFTHGVGDTHGETIEQNWSGLNKAAAQTKPMGPGTRQLTLDYMIGHHNSMYVHALEQQLPRRALKTIKSYAIAHPEFQRLHDGLFAHDPVIVQQWLQDERDWQLDKNKTCPYEYHSSHKTMKEVELELENEALEVTADGTVVVHECTPPRRMLSIDILSMKDPTAAQQVELLKRARNLTKRIQRYRRQQQVYMPGLRAHLSTIRRDLQDGVEDPQSIELYLPSGLPNARARAAVCAPGLSDVEARLREGEAHEALEDIRRALRARTVTNMFRHQHSRGNVLATRARSAMDKISKRAHTAKLRYRYSRNALLHLRGHGLWEDALRPLYDDDSGVYTAGVVARGDSSRTLSWIWYSVPHDPSLTDAVQNEALRVEYLKSKARRDRHCEELQLLLEEMRRVIQTNRTDAADWQQRAIARSTDDERLREGLRSYALEHAARADARADRLEVQWKEVRERVADALALRFSRVQGLQDSEAQQELDDLIDGLDNEGDPDDDEAAS